MSDFTATLQSFFTTYLVGQRGASQHTIAAYRDTFKLFLTHLHETSGLTPDRAEFTDIDAEATTEFLTYLENTRKNTIRTRNARLAAIHAFFTYAAYQHPQYANSIARVLAIQGKRSSSTVLTYLTDPELNALLNAPKQTTLVGYRDYVMIMLFVTTGLRVSELTALTWQDLQLGKPAYVLCHGKGRKDRITPLNKQTTAALEQWLVRTPGRQPEDPIFTPQGSMHALSRDAIAARLQVHCASAARTCPTLTHKKVTPHTLRHTMAMRMLQAGIDITTIALWLGHESTQTTEAYLHADLGIKERAMSRTTPIGTSITRFQPDGPLLAFLESL